MAIADQALRFLQNHAGSFRRVHAPSTLLILPAILCAITLGSCAQNTVQSGIEPNRNRAQRGLEANHNRVQIAARARHHSQKRVRPVDLALLAPQPAPDCKFDQPVSRTVDPDQLERLKLDYERQCYQNAEKTVRERLASLQRAVDGMHR
jgi:hypothetical protein